MKNNLPQAKQACLECFYFTFSICSFIPCILQVFFFYTYLNKNNGHWVHLYNLSRRTFSPLILNYSVPVSLINILLKSFLFHIFQICVIRYINEICFIYLWFDGIYLNLKKKENSFLHSAVEIKTGIFHSILYNSSTMFVSFISI